MARFTFLLYSLFFLASASAVYGQADSLARRILNDLQSGKYGQITGAIQTDGQYYLPDSLIGAQTLKQRFGSNTYANLTYTLGRFSAGARYEAYYPTLIGIDPRYNGHGIPIRFAAYQSPKLSIRVGHFYEQFGSGLSLRSWWEPLLGYDNALDGLQVHATVFRGIRVKGVIGRQRRFFDHTGLVRGGDLEFDLAEALDSLWKSDFRIRIGGSFVSKYQTDDDSDYKLPENVATAAGRIALSWKGFRLDAEYAYKANDPATTNELIYRPGQALFLSASYSANNLGVTLSAKRLDNMDFRADRYETGQVAQINFLPPLAKQHTYRLPSLYIYATQPGGEMGVQADVVYTLPAGSKLGGAHGTNINLNYARIHAIDTTRLPGERNYGYNSSFFAVGKRLFYQDLNVEISRKWSKKLKTTLSYFFIQYDKDKILGLSGYGTITAQGVVLEAAYKIKPRHTLRVEAQWMDARQDQSQLAPGVSKQNEYGSWAMLLAEYTFSPHFFLAVSDEYNYGNPEPEKRLHYYAVSAGVIKGGTRFSIGYGRQRAGIICVGGVCRQLPATNGVSVSLSTTF